MNLNAIVGPIVAAIESPELLQVYVSTGATDTPSGDEIPTYDGPIAAMGSVQPLSFGDIQKIAALNIQGERRAIYLNSWVDGIVRPLNKGGDKIMRADGSWWLVALVLEYWGPPSAPEWSKCAVTLQNGS